MKKETLKKTADFIAKWESFKPNKYLCPAGHWTFGYGFLIKDYPNIKLPITEKKARTMLEQRILSEYYPEMMELVNIPLTENQKIALTSFCYNLGIGAFERSTLRKKLNSGDYKGASEQFKYWKWAGGKVLQGLVNRRREEKEIFLTADECVSEDAIKFAVRRVKQETNWLERILQIIDKYLIKIKHK